MFIKKTTILLTPLLLIFPHYCLAADLLPAGKEKGYTELSDLTTLMINIANYILGIVGSLTLLAFVIGGVLFIISAGNNEKVSQAKQIIIGAATGLVIVFVSYTIIGFVLSTLGVEGASKWSSANWFK